MRQYIKILTAAATKFEILALTLSHVGGGGTDWLQLAGRVPGPQLNCASYQMAGIIHNQSGDPI